MTPIEALVPLAGVLGNFISLTIILYLYFTTRHKERMALIESGRDASIFHQSSKRRLHNNLKWGMVGVMLGASILVGQFFTTLGMPERVAFPAMMLLFGGAGLIGYYLLIHTKLGEVEEL